MLEPTTDRDPSAPRGETIPVPADPQEPPLAPHDPTDPGPQDLQSERMAQQRELLAVGIALDSRVLKICARHNRIYCDPCADLGAAFGLALQTFRRHGSDVRIFRDEHALLDLLSAKISEADDRCPHCADAGADIGAAADCGGDAEPKVSCA